MAAESNERLHALDAVRGFALLAGVVFHATLSFLPAPASVPVWVIMDNHRSLALAVVFHVLHIFRMTIFFLIAGFFARMMVEKRGVAGFVRNRAKRIALPLVVGWPFIFAAIVAGAIWGAVVMAHGGPLPKSPPSHFPAFPLTHLWFLYLLLWFYAASLLLRAVVGPLDRACGVGRLMDSVVGTAVRNPIGVFAVAAPTAAILCLTPRWAMWFGVPTPDSSLLPNPAAFVAYFSAFGFGWLVHRQPQLLEIWKRRWPLNLGWAIAATTVGFAITGVAPLFALAKPGLVTEAYASAYALAAWSWTFALIGLALRYLAGFSATRRYVADASYWIYLIHIPILIVLQVAVSQLPAAALVKYVAILAIAFPLMFGSYQLLVRRSVIGAVLNGRRYPSLPRVADTRPPAPANRRAPTVAA